MAYLADRQLVRRVLDRQPDAIQTFADRVACILPFLRRSAQHAASRVPGGAIEDIAQEAFLSIWRKLDGYRGESALETWACGFAFVELRRWRERDARRRERQVEVEDVHESEDPGVDDCMELFDSEIARLGRPTAEIFRLKHVAELTFDTIGEQLDMSPNTAKSLYYRGLARLRERLRGLGEGLAG